MFVHNADDLQNCLRSASGWVEMEGVDLSQVPPELGNLSKVAHITFKRCTLGSFPDAAFGLGSEYKQVKVDFYQCDFDADALFDRALDQGLGNWKVRVFGRGNKSEPRWKTLLAIGSEHEGTPSLRRAAYALLAGSLSPETPTAHVIPLLNHGKAPVRRAAGGWLDVHFQAPQLTNGTQVLVLGKPERLERDEVTELLEARGLSETRALKSAGAVLLLQKPGKRLAQVLELGLPLLVEGHLEAAPQAAPSTETELDRLDDILFANEPATILVGLRLLGGRELDDRLLADTLALALFHDDKGIRKAARELVLAKAPDTLRGPLAGDRRRYHTVQDSNKIHKALVAFSKLGVDPVALAVAVVRVRAMPENLGESEALTAALRIPGADRPALAALAHLESLAFGIQGSFPQGLEQLRALKELLIESGSTIKSDENVAALASLPNRIHLDVRPRSLDLTHLLPVAERLMGLAVSYTTSVKHPELLPRFSNLEILTLERMDLTDLGHLSSLPLRILRIPRVQATDLSPLAELAGTLKVLDISHVKADLSPLQSLTGLQELNMVQTGVKDLSFVKAMPELRTLDIGNAYRDDLAELAGHPSLEVLHIGYFVREGQVDLSALLEVPKLRAVHGVGTVTPEAAEQLRAARPQLWISH